MHRQEFAVFVSKLDPEIQTALREAGLKAIARMEELTRTGPPDQMVEATRFLIGYAVLFSDEDPAKGLPFTFPSSKLMQS